MPGIDGLRAIAVAAVFAYHVNASWLPGGFFGVDVFFVISGYLITSLLIAELAATGGVRLARFWAARARRLLPALFLLLTVCLLIGATVERGKLVGLRGDSLSSIFYVANWRFIFEHESYFAQFGRPPLLRHLWSLAVEEQFYLIWPPLFVLGARFLRDTRLAAAVAVAAIASAGLMWVLYNPGADTSRVFYGTDTRAAPLLVGVLLAFLWKPSAIPVLRRTGRWALEAASAVALAALVYMFVAVHDFDQFTYRGGFLALALCSAVLLATIVHPAGGLGRVLATRLPRWIGERSYGIYLWHWPVLCLSRPGVDVHLARGLLVPAQVAVTLVIAELSYRFVEQPIRSGGLRRIRKHGPRLVRQPRTPFALTGASIAALLALVAITPRGATALPPGFTRATLADAQQAATHLVLPPGPGAKHNRHHRHDTKTRRSAATAPTTSAGATQSRRSRFRHRSHHRALVIPRSGPILAVGDSVMLGASSALDSTLGPDLHIDAVVSRQPETTISRLFAYRTQRSLPARVIVHIGDNGPVYYADAQRLKAALAGVPLVVLVNVRVNTSWEGEVNSQLLDAVKGWHQATVADWYDASSAPGLVVDGTHTSPEGATAFAGVISRALHSPHLGGVTH